MTRAVHEPLPNALELVGVTKRFAAVTALDAATLHVRAGTLHALLGENGAGKTTLMHVAFGMTAPDAGTILVDGATQRFASPADAIRAGVGMVHQHFTVVPSMTVAENVALGRSGRYDRREAVARVRRVVDDTGLALDPDAVVGALGIAAQQRLEIVKALSRDVRTLILDEPTAVLAPAESRDLLAWLRRFADDGHAVVLITHKLRDALAVADDVTVLRRGRTVGALKAGEATEAALAELMLGTPTAGERVDPDQEVARPQIGAAPVRVSARGVRVVDGRGVVRVRDASLEARGGEIMGIAGVEGAGQYELLRVLAGRLAPSSGTLELPPPDAIGFVPEDRHRDALMLDASLTANLALRDAGARRGVVRWGRVSRAAARLLEEYDVRTGGKEGSGGGPATRARALSGGNQQKFVLAREMAATTLVVENPTRGLDIRATAAVHRRLRDASAAGAAVIVYSSDLDEIVLLADRVLVMHDGRVVPVPAEREAIGRAMLGATPTPA